MPLVNTPREQETFARRCMFLHRLARSFNPDAPKPERDLGAAGCISKTKPKSGRAADFIIDTISREPGRSGASIARTADEHCTGGADGPGIVALTKAIYIMGAAAPAGLS